MKQKLSRIRLLLTDVDGCLTDNRLFYVPDGQGNIVETKGFSSQDGMSMRWLQSAGIEIGWISGRDSPATVTRAKMLGVKYLYQNHLEKLVPYAEILKQSGATHSESCDIRQDRPVPPCMLRPGVLVAVGNAD